MEFIDPAYGQVHMLTVACFMVQHGRYLEGYPPTQWASTAVGRLVDDADIASGYLDEYGQPNATLYCDLVRQWGRVTCQEMQVPSG